MKIFLSILYNSKLYSNCGNDSYLTFDQANKKYTSFHIIAFRQLQLSNVKLGLFCIINTLQTSLHNIHCYV